MKDLKEKDPKALASLLAEKREEIRVIRFGTSGSRVRDVRAQRKARRDIARVLTEMKRRESAV